MVRETRSPTTFQFYISTIIMMEFKAVVGDPVPFQFYISTIIMKKPTTARHWLILISILHKYDYNRRSCRPVREWLPAFQFYISTIIIS